MLFSGKVGVAGTFKAKERQFEPTISFSIIVHQPFNDDNNNNNNKNIDNNNDNNNNNNNNKNMLLIVMIIMGKG